MTSQSLQDFIKSVDGTSHLRVEQDFGDGFVRLETSEAERRQAIQDIRCSEDVALELLRNSRDAHASNIYVATTREGNARSFTVVDNGQGIPSTMHKLVFEPRVTSKLDSSHIDAWGLHGRGMALYSIAVNSREAYVASSDVNAGCALHVKIDTNTISEKKDQSSFPTFELDETGVVNVRGPKNILRTCCEFAIESRAQCNVYVGSNAEICATLYEYGANTLSTIDRIFSTDAHSLPIVKRLATSADPAEFAKIARSLGLDISERTARRIMKGDIAPCSPLIESIVICKGNQPTSRDKRKGSARRGIKISRNDQEELLAKVSAPFADLAEKYYLEPNLQPTIRVSGDKLVISFDLVPTDA